MQPELPIILDEWPRDARHSFRVSLSEYWGSKTVDLRNFYKASGGYRPSPKGLTLSVRHLKRLAEAVAAVDQKAADMDLK